MAKSLFTVYLFPGDDRKRNDHLEQRCYIFYLERDFGYLDTISDDDNRDSGDQSYKFL